jgi:hypothetical protein
MTPTGLNTASVALKMASDTPNVTPERRKMASAR